MESKELFFYELEGRDMELIKELGGYEKAKSERDKINHSLNNGDFLGGGSPREYLYERLSFIEIDLLEHRREHNIFEVGDRVVLLGDGTWGHLFEVEKMSPRGRKPTKLKTDVFGNFHVGYNVVRHATDVEIATGHRL